MNDDKIYLSQLKEKVKSFCEQRDWDQFHSAKELSIGAITEASELLEHFRFLSQEQVQAKMEDPKARAEIGEELADVLFFLLRFSQRYNFSLEDCFTKKMAKNAKKYPVDEFKGKNHKSSHP